MHDDTFDHDAVTALTRAVGALGKAAERALVADAYDGAGDALVNNYRSLQAKLAETLPDDFYVASVLKLDVPAEADDRQKVSLVQVSAGQMHTYLQGMLHDHDDFPPGVPPWVKRRRRHGHPRDFGRELSEDILEFTKETIRRALSSVDFDIEFEEETRKRKNDETDDEDEPISRRDDEPDDTKTV